MATCRARGTERFGLVASSGAQRLRPEGIHINAELEPANWFLKDSVDVRSSYYLEDVATEFAVQGLELDWVGVYWDGDFHHNHRRISGPTSASSISGSPTESGDPAPLSLQKLVRSSHGDDLGDLSFVPAQHSRNICQQLCSLECREAPVRFEGPISSSNDGFGMVWRKTSNFFNLLIGSGVYSREVGRTH
jgi:hypothetical protein